MKLRHRRSVSDATEEVRSTEGEDLPIDKNGVTLGSVIEKIFTDIDAIKSEIDDIRFPKGQKDSPARSCRDLYYAHPEYKDGWYWIDPNLGVINDAINVWCNMTAEGQTCVYPKKGHDMVIPRSWKKPAGADRAGTLFSQLKDGFEIEYGAENQLAFLRLLYDGASQKFTYFCSNSIAFLEKSTNSYGKGISLWGHNDHDFSFRTAARKPFVVLDTCSERQSSGFTIFHLKTQKAAQLPITDLQIQDFGADNQKFGFEVGPVCFN